MSDFGVSLLSIIPVRANSSDTAEMVTQVLFGESYKVLESGDKWVKIQLDHDGYVGWIDKKQTHLVNELADTHEYSYEITSTINLGGMEVQICLGSSLPNFESGEGGVADFTYSHKGLTAPSTGLASKEIVATSKKLLGTPYLWGGRTPFGIDCSGFSQLVYKLHGIMIHRDTSQQVQQGKEVDFADTQEGDLAFFDSNEKITHVGIVMQGNQIIHASGKVRIDSLDEQGILNKELKEYSHKLYSVRSYF
ncbi:C40 family peptidase [bacterium AH-315-C07]|nr:C40 family peptidase [bacterium AH-315-C07]